MHKQWESAQQIESTPFSQAVGDKLSNCFAEIIENSMGTIIQEFNKKIESVKQECERMVSFKYFT